MSNDDHFLGVVTMGEPKKLSHTETIRFEIHDFANQDPPDKVLYTPTMRSHGNDWRLQVYPHGNDCPQCVSVYLELMESKDKTVEVDYTFVVGSRLLSYSSTFTPGGKTRWGYKRFMSRDDWLSETHDGVFVVEVELRVMVTASPIWKLPRATPFPPFMAKLEHLAEFSDCDFVVDGETFFSHKNILALRAPSLLALATDEAPHVELPGISKDSFKDFLHFVYTGELSSTYDDLDSILTLMELADRFACVSLKLDLEAKIVEELLTESNAIRLLLFSDSHTCALLYEASMEMICKQGNDLHWNLIGESTELASKAARYAMAKKHGKKDEDDGCLDYLGISSLRRQLHSCGQDVDGSRETLLRRLYAAKHDDNSSTAASTAATTT